MNMPPSSALPVPATQTPTRAMVLTLGLVAAICGLIIVSAYEGSLSAVRDNRRVALERAITKVLPGANKTISYLALPDGAIVAASGGDAPVGTLRFHAAYDAKGSLMGIAAEGSAKGYADTVRILFGYSPPCACIVGIGDKILTDTAFLANFKALDTRLNAELSGLANEVKTVKHGTKTQAWQVDAISGATITSRAVGRAINEASQALLPRLVPKLEQIQKAP